MIDFERILHPTDFSPQANNALRYACGLAAQYGAELHLLHVVPEAALMESGVVIEGMPPNQAWLDSVIANARTQLAEMPERQWAEGRRVVRATARGAVFVEIIQYARNHGADLIVMGTHGRGGLTHMLLGSVAERVVRKAPCPVLTVRPPGQAFQLP